MMLAEIKPRPRTDESLIHETGSNPPENEVVDVADFDFVSWDVYSCWKQQHADRFGGGNPAPSIPNSQR